MRRLCIGFVIFGLMLGGALDAVAGTSHTVVSEFGYGSPRLPRELQSVVLAGFGLFENEEPLVSLRWDISPDSIFGVLDSIVLHSPAGAVELAMAIPQRRGNQPRFYQTRMSYAPATGAIAVVVRDTATDRTIVDTQVQIDPLAPQPLLATAGFVQPGGVSKDAFFDQGLSMQVTEESGVFVPAGLTWVVGQDLAATAILDRRKATYVAIQGIGELAGDVLLATGTDIFSDQSRVILSGSSPFPIDLTEVPSGVVPFHLLYRDELGQIWNLGGVEKMISDGDLEFFADLWSNSPEQLAGIFRLHGGLASASAMYLAVEIEAYRAGRWVALERRTITVDAIYEQSGAHGSFAFVRPSSELLRITLEPLFPEQEFNITHKNRQTRIIPPYAPTPPFALWNNVVDYGFMYFPEGIASGRHGGRAYWGEQPPAAEFHIHTSRYFLSFDMQRATITRLLPIANPLPEREALRQDPEEFFAPSLTPVLEMTMVTEDGRYAVTGATNANRRTDPFQNSWLIESGKYFQRRYVPELMFEDGAPAVDASMEIAAWPDRFSLILAVRPQVHLAQARLEISLSTLELFISQATGNMAAIEFDDGSGLLVLGGDQTGSVAIAGQNLIVSLPDKPWSSGEEHRLELVVYPIAQGLSAAHAQVVATEQEPLQMTAQQVYPSVATLPVSYDSTYGWHTVQLQGGGGAADPVTNERMERVLLTVTNPTAEQQPLRINFAKERSVFGITGISAILRDHAGNPLGIPVQISKNWHRSDRGPVPFEGPWMRNFTMLTIPANTTVHFEYTSVNALWGIVPAASHAQLSLVGWGGVGNHQWDQAAIGAWGETITFEPDPVLSSSFVCDLRPLMVTSMRDEQWNWTHNVGGADYLVYVDSFNRQQFLRQVRTSYQSYGPNLTSAIYAGVTADGKIESQVEANVYRTDDITRTVFRLRYQVQEEVSFNRLVFFQVGADDYNYTQEQQFAWGNEQGLVQEWATQWGGHVYRTGEIPLTGDVVWFSMHDAIPFRPGGAWANRGVILRSWDARLGGEAAQPYAAEYGTVARGLPTSIIDIVPPPGVTTLLSGDYVEAEIVLIVLPKFAADYYGPNENLQQALSAYENSWQLVLREALGNHLQVTASMGTVLQHYPVRVQVDATQQAEFSVSGGIGYVPITIDGLSSFTGFSLWRQEGETFSPVNQSLHGRDYWQTNYHPETGTWSMTYTVNLDTPGDERQIVRFRLEKE